MEMLFLLECAKVHFFPFSRVPKTISLSDTTMNIQVSLSGKNLQQGKETSGFFSRALEYFLGLI